jgi:hypothetical protein
MKTFGVKTKIILADFILVAVVSFVYLRNYSEISTIYSWTGKQILFPDSLLVYSNNFVEEDSLSDFLLASQPKIIVFTDAECSNCLFLFSQWNKIITKYGHCAQFVFIVKTNSILSLKANLELQDFKHPIVIDSDDRYRFINGIDNDIQNCLLLDSNNCITTIGNPILFKKIEDIYESIFLKES